ncbi:MAG: hypothetical protein K0S32_3366 [Bacteroidetes bacterium]|jgi:hypothetical protein|nr:hypothetical protein [Bacteroidota bacterium]
MNEQQEKKKRRGVILWVLIALLVGTNGFTCWLLFKEKNKVIEQKIVTETIIVERDNVKSDLLALQKDFANLEASDALMQKDIDEKKARIEELIKQAEKHKGDAYIIAQLRKETETLREIMKHYVVTIDSLNTLNQNLIAEKKTVLKQLDQEKEKQDVLVKEKEELKTTIAKGSILTCFNVSAKAVFFKRGGKKVVETSKAKKMEKIKVTFSLGENKIAKPGEKTVFIRVMTPDGKEMAKSYDDSYKFTFNKSNGYYAGKETLNYANAEITGQTYCEGQGEYVPGNYQIEITCDGVVIGSSTLKLD